MVVYNDSHKVYVENDLIHDVKNSEIMVPGGMGFFVEKPVTSMLLLK